MGRTSSIAVLVIGRQFCFPAPSPFSPSARPDAFSKLLFKRRLTRFGPAICLGLLALLPLSYVARQYSADAGFTRLIYFGAEFYARALPEVREAHPAVTSRVGYDGQFYAQLAIDPSLKNPALKEALDAPAYRATRIFLPALAHLLALGRPALILQVYALINLLFWYLLFGGMLFCLRPSTPREYACVVAACFTSGVLFSVQRALLDLPAATLLFLAASARNSAGAFAIIPAMLTKEFYLLGLGAVFRNNESRWQKIGRGLLLVTPLMLWLAYVHHRFGWTEGASGNFGLPFAGYASAITRGFRTVGRGHFALGAITELLAPICLLVQVFFLLAMSRNYASPYWKMGAGFALASVVIGPEPFVEQMSFCRDLVPVTLAFNIGLMRDRRVHFLPWFLAGNLGLTFGFFQLLKK